MSVCIIGEGLFYRMLKNRLLAEGKDLTDDPQEAAAVVVDRKKFRCPEATFCQDSSVVESMMPALGMDSEPGGQTDFWLIRRFHPQKGFTEQTFVFLQSKGLVKEDQDSDIVIGAGGRFVRKSSLRKQFTTLLGVYLQSMDFRGPVAVGFEKKTGKVTQVRLDFPLWAGQLMLEGAANYKHLFLENSYDYRLYESWVLGTVLFRDEWPWTTETKSQVLVETQPKSLARLWSVEEIDGDTFTTKSTLLGLMTSFGGTLDETGYHLNRLASGVKCPRIQYRMVTDDIRVKWNEIVDLVLDGGS